MTDPTTELVEVMQEDREAFVAMCRIHGGPPVDVSFVLMGQADNHPGVQSYARHRLSTRSPAPEQVEATLDQAIIHLTNLLSYFNEKGHHRTRVDFGPGVQSCAVAGARAFIAALGGSPRG